MSATPIALVYLTQEEFSREKYKVVQSALEKKITDYHVIVVPSHRKEAIEVEVVNGKNINRVTLQQLKGKIEMEIASFKKDNDGTVAGA